MKTFGRATIAQADEHGVLLALDGGGSFSVEVLEASMFRVRHKPAGGYREPRTWASAPLAGKDVPWEGRARDDGAGFNLPPAQISRQHGQISLRTDALSVTVQEHPLAMSWHDRDRKSVV